MSAYRDIFIREDTLVHQLGQLEIDIESAHNERPSLDLVLASAELAAKLPDLFFESNRSLVAQDIRAAEFLLGLASQDYERYRHTMEKGLTRRRPINTIRTEAFTIPDHLDEFVKYNLNFRHSNHSVRSDNAFNLAIALVYDDSLASHLNKRYKEGDSHIKRGIVKGLAALKKLGYDNLLAQNIDQEILRQLRSTTPEKMQRAGDDPLWHAEFVSRCWDLKPSAKSLAYNQPMHAKRILLQSKLADIVEHWQDHSAYRDEREMLYDFHMLSITGDKVDLARLRAAINPLTSSLADGIYCATQFPSGFVLYSLLGKGGFKTVCLGTLEFYARDHEGRIKPIENISPSWLQTVKIFSPTQKGTDILGLARTTIMEAAVTELGGLDVRTKIHPNVSFVSHIAHDPRTDRYFMTEEWNNRGSLMEAFPQLNEMVPLDYTLSVELLSQAYAGLNHLPNMGLRCHGDIKPQNCMVHHENGGHILRLTDLHQAPYSAEPILNVGYPFTMDPTLLCNKNPADIATDLYSIGQLAMLFFTGDYLVQSRGLITGAERKAQKSWNNLSIEERMALVDIKVKQATARIRHRGLKKYIAKRLDHANSIYHHLGSQQMQHAYDMIYALLNPRKEQRSFLDNSYCRADQQSHLPREC